jgi:hypothetical protein
MIAALAFGDAALEQVRSRSLTAEDNRELAVTTAAGETLIG